MTSKKSSLLEALEFVDPVMKTGGNNNQTHIVINNKVVTVFDGQIAASYPIEEEISCCPQFAPLKAAVKRSGNNMSLSITDNNVSIASGKFKAVIKCIQFNELMTTIGDIQNPISLNDSFRSGFSILDKVIKEEDSNVAKCSLLLKPETMIATDGILFLEYWHGFHCPSMIVPKRVIQLVSKVTKTLVGITSTPDRSITFWFDNGAWIKSQLMDTKWPDMSAITNLPINAIAVPTELKEAVAAVQPHSEDTDGALHLGDGVLRSHPGDWGNTGAAFEVVGLPGGQIFSGRHLAIVADIATGIDWAVMLRGKPIAGFYADRLRGFLMARER